MNTKGERIRYRLTENGLSLLEMMIALAIFGIIITAIYNILDSQRHAYDVQDQMVEMEQNARAATSMVLKEVRMAGYNALGNQLVNSLPDWVPSDFIPTVPATVNLDANPKITLGDGANPDIITFLSVLDSDNNPAALSTGVSAGAAQIVLSLNATETDEQYNVDDLVHIGMTSEYAIVTSIAGNVLTIDTNPVIPGNQGLAASYTAGTPIGEISVISYTVFNDDNDPSCSYHEAGHPVLKRKVNAGGFQPVAENITDLQITHLGGGELQIELTAQTDKKDFKYPVNNGFHTYQVAQKIKIRNTGDIMSGSSCAIPSTPSVSSISGLDGITYPCQVHLEWSAVTSDVNGDSMTGDCELEGYRIYYDTTSGTYENYEDVSAGSVTHTWPVSGDYCTYYVKVAARNSGGIGAKSSEYVITDTTAPSAPAGLSATTAGVDNQVNLSWSANSECDVAGYNIYRSQGDNTSYNTSPINGSKLVTGTTYTDTKLLTCPSATYYYKLQAVDACPNISAFSGDIPATISDYTGPPSNLEVSPELGNKDSVTWSASSQDVPTDQQTAVPDYIVSYRLYGTKAADGLVELIDTISADGSISYSNSSNISTGYYSSYAVRAVDSCGNESVSITMSSACVTVPTVVISSPASGTTVSGTVAINGTVTVADGRSLSSLQIQIGNGGEWQDMPIATGWNYMWDTSSYSDGTYDISVKAEDSEGCSSIEAISLVLELCSVKPTVSVTTPVSGDTVSGTVTISGQATSAEGRALNRVEVQIDSGSWEVAGGTTTWNLSWNTGSVSDGSHTIHVQAFDDAGCFSDYASVGVAVNNSGEEPRLTCTLHTCVGSDDYGYVKVYVKDQNNDPVSGATVRSSVELKIGSDNTDTMSDLGAGWYGGDSSPACFLNSGDPAGDSGRSAQSKDKYSSIPLSLTVTVSKEGYTDSSCSN